MQSTYVAFEGRQVCVRSDLEDVHEALRQRCAALLQARGDDLIGQLDVEEQDGQFRVRNGPEIVIADPILVNVLEQLHRAVTQLFIDGEPDLLWIHAAAVSNERGAVLLPGSWGHGKSSLSAALARRGWSYLSDDLAPLDRDTDCLLPFPAMPSVRRKPDAAMERERLGEIPKDIVALPGESLAKGRQQVRCLIFPSYEAEVGTALSPCPPASAVVELLRNCLNFSAHGGKAVGYLCRLLAPLPTYRLTYNDIEAACDLIDGLGTS